MVVSDRVNWLTSVSAWKVLVVWGSEQEERLEVVGKENPSCFFLLGAF
jgi:hypothetical protein